MTSIRTNNAGSTKGNFNGCWLEIVIPIPSSYTAPQSGWWKIEYTVGSGTATAFDVTTWEVSLRGNPVHLVP